MALPNIFSAAVANQVINRIHQLTPTTAPQWGTMSVGQMLAHCNVTYEMIYEDKHPKPNFLVRFMLKMFVKGSVVNETPYPKNSRTAPQFLIKETKDFEAEKARLIAYIEQTQQLGKDYFEAKPSHSFGALKSEEWNNMLYKHLDHHLSQFGV